jgi:hypothetical protein
MTSQITYLESLQAYQEYLYKFNKPETLDYMRIRIDKYIETAKHRTIESFLLHDIFISLENEMESIITEKELLPYEQFIRDHKLNKLL